MYFALGYLVFVFAFEPIFDYLCVVRSNRTLHIVKILLLAISIAIIGYHIQPGSTSDLKVYYTHLLRVYSFQTYITYVNETGLYTWGAILLLVNKLGDIRYLSSLVSFASILTIGKMSLLYYDNVDNSRRTWSYFYIMLCALLQWQTLLSGLRNCLSYTLLSLVIIEYIINKDKGNSKRRYLYYAILVIIAIGIHPASWFLLAAFLLVAVGKIKKWTYVLAGIWSFIIYPLPGILQSVPIAGARYAGEKLTVYLGQSLKFGNISLIVQMILLLFLLLQVYRLKTILAREGKTYYTINTLFLFLFLAIGSSNIELIFRRFQIPICFMLFPMLSLEKKYFSKIEYKLSALINMAAAIMLIVYNYVKITNHMSFI